MNDKLKLHILYTSDIHGHILPINYSDNSSSQNGLSLLSSKITQYDKNHRILLDLGDAIQGSPMMYFHQLNRIKYPNPVSSIFNYLEYDYFIPGNHDFNYGKQYLKDFISQLNAKTLCQNIYLHNKLLFKFGYDIKEFDHSVKVLTIGITTKYIPNWENPKHIKNYLFKDPVDEAKKVIAKHKESVDLVILAYHGGFEKDLHTGEEFVKDTGENQGYRLFNEIKGVDILLTGHQHRTICETINDTVIIQPGGNAMSIGVIDVDFDLENKTKMMKPYLIKAKDLIEDNQIRHLLKDIEKDTERFLDEVIGIVPENNLIIHDSFLARRDKHPIIDFINQIQLDASKAMLSSTSLANQVSGFHKEITIRNVLSTYVYANTLVVVEIDGKTLKAYLEKCAEYFIIKDNEITFNPRFEYPKLEHYNYDMIDGIEYSFDLRNEFGNRVVSIKYNQKEILPSDSFTLVLNNYRATGGGDFLMLKELPIIKEIPLDVAELMIDYIRKHKYIDIKSNKNIKLIK